MKDYLRKETQTSSNWIALGVFAIGLATALFGFFERYPLYHDEMINTFKAEIGLVFDYALRPLTYGLNYLAYEFFGSSPKSLLLMASFMYSFTGLILYIIGRRHFTVSIGLLCASLFLASPLIVSAGIRSMPHIYSAAFCALSLLVFSRLWTEQGAIKSSYWAILTGVCSVLTVSTHPTMLGIYVLLMTWGISGLVIRKYIFSSLFPENLNNRSLLIMLASGVVAFGILNIVYKVEYGRYYIEVLNSLFSKIDRNSFDNYKEPWYTYLVMITDRHRLAAYFGIICIAVILPFSVFQTRYSKLFNSDNNTIAFAFVVSLFSIGFLASLSLASWKFERVLVGYYPIMMLSIGLMSGVVLKVLSEFLPHRMWAILSPVVISLLIANNYRDLGHSLDSAIGKKRDVYYRIHEKLNTLEGDTISLITNDTSKKTFVHRYSKLSRLSVSPIEFDENIKKNQIFLNGLQNKIAASNSRYILIDTKILDQVVTSQDKKMPFSHWLRVRGGQSLYSWIDRLELWVFEDKNYGESSALTLLNLRGTIPGKRIGVLSGFEVLGNSYQRDYRQVADALRKAPYRLNFTNRDAIKTAGYLDTNHVNVIALPKAIELAANHKKMSLLTEHLSSNGWRFEVSLGDLSLDIWVRSM